MRILSLVLLLLLVAATFGACTVDISHAPLAPRELPEDAFAKEPEQAFDTSSYIISLQNMATT